ncbi:MAG: hypothetical protein NVS9B4_08120 [Candidatus Acidiferrum sp.]
MTRRVIVGVSAITVLAFVIGGFFLLHERAAPSSHAPVTAAEATSQPPAAMSSGPSPTGQPPSTVESPESANPKAPTPAGVPRVGEVLDFTAQVSKLSNVANLRLKITEHRNFLGKAALHLQALAHTENPLRMVFELDDQFDSYSDAASLASLQYEMHLSERGQKMESVQRMTTSGTESAPPDATAAHVLPGTRDPLGMLQYLRGVDWTKTPQVRSPVYDGHKLYDVRAQMGQSSGASVSVPAGGFSTSKIELHVFDNGSEMKDARFTLYLANNAARTPVLLEAILPFATARVELVRVR